MAPITRREFVKRTAVAGAVLTSFPAILEACNSSTPTSNKPSKLTIAAVQGAEDGPLKKVAPMYQSQSGITMEIVEFPYDQLFEKLVTTFQANGSSYDLCMMDDPWMPKFGTMGALQPLDSNFGFTRDSDIPSIVYDVGTWPPPKGPVPPSEQGKSQHLYGITVVGNVEMFMYRKDIVTTAPASWDDVLANAQQFNKSNFYGYVIRGKATNPASSDSLPILWSFGGDIFDTSWKVTLDSTESIDAITFLTQTLKKYAEPGAANTDAADRDRLISIGQALQSTRRHPDAHQPPQRRDPRPGQPLLPRAGTIIGRRAELAPADRPVERGRDALRHGRQPGGGRPEVAQGRPDRGRHADSLDHEAGGLPLLKIDDVSRSSPILRPPMQGQP